MNSFLLSTYDRLDVSKNHPFASSHITVDIDGDDSSSRMDIQINNNLLVETNDIGNNQATTPNTLHKNLIEIAQQKLLDSDERNQNEKVIRCKKQRYLQGQ